MIKLMFKIIFYFVKIFIDVFDANHTFIIYIYVRFAYFHSHYEVSIHSKLFCTTKQYTFNKVLVDFN